MTIAFRSATTHDIPLLQALARAIWPGAYDGIISAAQIAYMLDRMYGATVIAAELERGVAWDLVLLDEVPIGYVSWMTIDAVTVKLNKLYLLPAGRGLGAAQVAIARVRAAARTSGHRRVSLVVNKRNLRAIAVYRKAGFTVAEDIVTDIGHGFIMDDHRMEIPA